MITESEAVALRCEVMTMSSDHDEIDALFDTAAQEGPALADLDGALSRLKAARAAKAQLSRLGAPALRSEIVRRSRAMGGGL
ncbi:hypothetical protein [Aeromicrobium sp. Leaf350]|uniref:hypothetical protein n=1 Tax=Aeromicrobium sp. Leaf350 TaxID=2876565 RepID=UPI001E5EAD17|nr:hypothetical protein [Aeromicrobium sp. Leaf350]